MKAVLALALVAGIAQAVWPIPSTYSNGSDVLWIDHSVKISYKGAGHVSQDDNAALPGTD
jgi:hexosaminidase